MKFAKKIANKSPVLGIELYSGSPQMVEVIGGSGFDFAMLDMEHTPYGMQHMSSLIRAAIGVGMSPIIRVPKLDDYYIMSALDNGAHGVIVPRIMNASDAENAVKASWFPPAGRRGMCPDVFAAQYRMDKWLDYAKNIRNEISVIPLIEDRVAVDNIEEIMQVDGIDCVLFGPGDFGVSIGGIEREFDQDVLRETKEAVVKICKAARKHNVYVIAIPYQDFSFVENTLSELLDDGVNGVLYSMDTSHMRMRAEYINDKFRDILG